MSSALKSVPHRACKNNRKTNLSKAEKRARRRKPVYDGYGRLLDTGEDLCDCSEKSCDGCYFPCPGCNSRKCGITCRVYRTFRYEEDCIEGDRERPFFAKNLKIKN